MTAPLRGRFLALRWNCVLIQPTARRTMAKPSRCPLMGWSGRAAPMAKAIGVFRLGPSAPAGSRGLIAHVTARHSRSCRIRGFGCGRRGLAGGNAGGIQGFAAGRTSRANSRAAAAVSIPARGRHSRQAGLPRCAKSGLACLGTPK
jgi:hypothetical protein